MEINTIINNDCLKGLKKLENESIDCCVSSPPYFNLRDYGSDGQIGLEDSPEDYVKKLVSVFHEVKRVLKKEGTLWLNIGDSYAGSGKGWNTTCPTMNKDHQRIHNIIKPFRSDTIKAKDLIGIPWMLAFALRNDGWFLRSEIIWAKDSVMPESVKDRPTKAHEQVFLLSKSKTYFYDYESIQEETTSFDKGVRDRDNSKLNNTPGRTRMSGLTTNSYEKRNKRSVWKVNPKPFSEAHFAVFPEKLIVDCIKAGCPENGVVLDPFMGSGTTALVSKKLNRNYLGFELNPEYIQIAEKRLFNELGIFA